MDDYGKGALGAEVVLRQIEPVVRKLSLDPRGWWQNRKRYSRFNENIAKSYVLSKLREIKMKGRGEADRFVEKLISNRKSDMPRDMASFIGKNRSVWADFIYRTAARLDPETLARFFVPFVYGGIISRKNVSGETFGVIDFEKSKENIPKNNRIMNAIGKIEGFWRRGISVIIIEGVAEMIYSPEMLSLYARSPSEAYIIIERETSEKNTLVSGKSAYDRVVLTKLGGAKNVLVLLSPNNVGGAVEVAASNDWLTGKSRALSSYGILHGICDHIDEKSCDRCKQGSVLSLFDSKISLDSVVGDSLDLAKRANGVFDVLPREVVEFLTSPALPVRLPDLYELLTVSQFIISGANIRQIRTEFV